MTSSSYVSSEIKKPKSSSSNGRACPLNSNNRNYLDMPRTKKQKRTKNNNKVGCNHDLITAYFTIEVEEVPKATGEYVMEIVEGSSGDKMQFVAVMTIRYQLTTSTLKNRNYKIL